MPSKQEHLFTSTQLHSACDDSIYTTLKAETKTSLQCVNIKSFFLSIIGLPRLVLALCEHTNIGNIKHLWSLLSYCRLQKL